MNLWQDFLINESNLISKWTQYFPIYERYFTPWRNKPLTFIEIGIDKGGSLGMWKRFFGPYATIIGIDINKDCLKFEEDNVHIRIGDQSDTNFLQSIIDEFGIMDIVLDDGSHQMNHIRESFFFLYPKISKNGLYIVEDLHTAYWPEYGGGIDRQDTFINITKNFIDKLNADHSRGSVEPDFITRNTLGISFFDSMIVFERGTIPCKKMVFSGKNL